MKSISATPENISTIFSDQRKYIIPDFQRPYSWEEEECLKLFEDLEAFYVGEEKDNSYYLGNIVYYKDKDNNFVVIDGQQRLTTITLFLQALFSISKVSKSLERCLKLIKPRTDEILPKTRLESHSLEKNKEELEDIILKNNYNGQGRITKNYNLLKSKVDEWIVNKSSEEVEKFIDVLLYEVVLLPIICEDEDDSLTIFNTLNNRGLPLNDGDIFKSLIYKNITQEEDKKNFTSAWNDLNKNNEIESLFRRLMYIDRAEKGIISKEIALRKYFDNKNNPNIFKSWEKIIEDLIKLHKDNMKFEDITKEREAKFENLLSLLDLIPHDYCHHPIFVFWYKYAEIKEGIWQLPFNKINDFESLLIRTIKYYYVFAISTRTVNSVKDTTFKICNLIWKQEDYLAEYKQKYTETFETFKRNIKEYSYGKMQRGLVYLLAINNEKQNHIAFNSIKKIEIEHILPKKGGYHNYNGWTEEQYEQKINTIGNLVCLEKSLNISASNDFFKKKKCEYLKSEIAEVKTLEGKFIDWTYNDWGKRNMEQEEKLYNFFHNLD